MAPVRRSGRTRVPNKLYTRDPFEGLKDVLGDSESEDNADQNDELDDDDEDFAEGKVAKVAPNDLEMSEGSEAGSFNEEGDIDEEDLSDAESSADSLVKRAKSGSKASHRRRGGNGANALKSVSGVHSRGVEFPMKHNKKDSAMAYSFGRTPEDVIPLMRSRQKWYTELTLPSRLADNGGRGGMGLSFYQPEEKRVINATRDWAWYYEEGGKASFEHFQRSEDLDEQIAQEYMPSNTNATRTYLTGPLPDQMLVSQPLGAAVNLEAAWCSTKEAKNPGRPSNKAPNSRCGFLLNVGDAVQCLDWAPNQSSLTQFLAISTIPKTRPQNKSYSAFYPSDPSPSCIQIWSFEGVIVAEDAATIDNTIQPKLRSVICGNWGNIRQFKWCPIIRQDVPTEQDSKIHYLGMLAVLGSDGKVRVLDLTCARDPHTPTKYIRISRAAFEARPPDTICTCVTWLSTSAIATGCANGFVSIWDIRQQLFPLPESFTISRPPPRPIFHKSFHSSYILALTSLIPSRPHHLLTTSTDGYHRLTSLRSSTSDTVFSQRSRVQIPALAWHDASQHALHADDGYTLRGMSLRRFYSSTFLTKEPAPVLCVAASPCHTAVLVGCADGTVSATNPLRRVLGRRHVAYFRQVWFKHEWRRGPVQQVRDPNAGGETNANDEGNRGEQDSIMTDAASVVNDPHHANASNPSDTATASVAPQQQPEAVSAPGSTSLPTILTSGPADPAYGLSRITRGYALVEQQAQGKSFKKQPHSVQGITVSTTYETPQAVRCVCWNPNVHVGGWAAAGLGSGLVRVEDVALDL